MLQRVIELQAAARGPGVVLAAHLERRALGQQVAGLGDAAVAAPDLAGQDQRLRAGAAFDQAEIDQRLVGPALGAQLSSAAPRRTAPGRAAGRPPGRRRRGARPPARASISAWVRARSTPSRPTSVALPAAWSLPAVLPMPSVVPTASSTSSAIWKAAPRSRPYQPIWVRTCGAARPRMAPGLGAVLDQPAGLQRLQPADLGGGQGLALGRHVDHLAARHAARAAGQAEGGDQLAAGERVGMGVRLGQQLEGAGLQRVAGQHRGRFVELRGACSACRGAGRRRPCRAGRRAPASRRAASRPRRRPGRRRRWRRRTARPPPSPGSRAAACRRPASRSASPRSAAAPAPPAAAAARRSPPRRPAPARPGRRGCRSRARVRAHSIAFSASEPSARLDDRLHARLRLGQLGLAMPAQRRAALVAGDGVLQLLLAAFQAAHDPLQFGQRVLEGQAGNVVRHAALARSRRPIAASGGGRARRPRRRARPGRSRPPAPRPACRRNAGRRRASSWSVIQPKSSVSSRSSASGSARCASNPAETISSSGAKASSAGRPCPPRPGGTAALPVPGRSGMLTHVVGDAALGGGAGAGVAGRLVAAGVEQVGVALEDVLGAVAVVHVEIDHGDALAAPSGRGRAWAAMAAPLNRQKPMARAALGVVARRAHGGEGGARPALHHRVDRRDGAAGGAQDAGLALPWLIRCRRRGRRPRPRPGWIGEDRLDVVGGMRELELRRRWPRAPPRAAAARSPGAPAPAAPRRSRSGHSGWCGPVSWPRQAGWVNSATGIRLALGRPGRRACGW